MVSLDAINTSSCTSHQSTAVYICDTWVHSTDKGELVPCPLEGQLRSAHLFGLAEVTVLSKAMICYHDDACMQYVH